MRLYLERGAEHQEVQGRGHPEVATIVSVPVDTVRTWARQAEVDAGGRPGILVDKGT
ncbi:hypothetical protein [Arthrobacter sp. NPDC058192]|uniref:hypothetical protein n=1 Tax=Arthrobacter sp. NPDC058192 TaxID=3346372 RepID=UPI0036F0236B